VTVTAIIPARDEEREIVDCLASVAWTEQRIVFVDDRTTDQTIRLARQAGAEAMLHPFENFAQFHNAAMALEQITTDWVLFVDADERVTPELADEIQQVLSDKERGEVLWWLPRHNYIFGRLTLGAGWYPDYQARLLRRGYTHWERPVHEFAVANGPEGYLQSPLVHYNYRDLPDFIARQQRYTDIDAGILFAAGTYPRWYTPYTQAVRHFWWRFVTLRGVQDGLHGLRLSLLMAYYEAVKYRKLARLWQTGNHAAR